MEPELNRHVYPFGEGRPLIGMVHLLPLPGTMYFRGDLDGLLDAALADAWNLANAGFDGLIVENYGDIPFRKTEVEPHTVAAMARVIQEIRREIDIPVGVNVLRNDARSAAGIAGATDCRFIRVNVLTGAFVTDQGIIEGDAAGLFAYIDRVAPNVVIYADINVKHARPLVNRPVQEMARETLERAGAHALIVTGTHTGGTTDLKELRNVRGCVNGPVLIGSGITRSNITELWEECDGMIVGSSVMIDGLAGNSVDSDRARDLISRVR